MLTGDSVALVDGALSDGHLDALRDLIRRIRPAQLLGYHDPAYQFGMQAILQDRLRHLILYDSTKALMTGYLPFREKASAVGTVINCGPFFGPNGLLLAEDDDARAELLSALRSIVDRPEVLSAVFYTPFLEQIEPFSALEPDRVLHKFTQYLDLSRFSAWPKKRLADIKRAKAAGFSIRAAQVSDRDSLYRIYSENCRSVRIPQKPIEYFDLTLALAQPDHHQHQRLSVPGWLVVAREDQVIGGLLFMRGPVTASYTIPIASAEERSHQPIAFLIEEAVAAFRSSGGRYWNFESSPRWGDPVFAYKERWGAEVSHYDILVMYPNGASRLDEITPAECARLFPFYFVKPFDGTTGVLPLP
jgi:hypothetical protein